MLTVHHLRLSQSERIVWLCEELGLDSELNVSWEAAPGDDVLARAIDDLRVDLLAEHCGDRDDPTARQGLGRTGGLVAHLDALAADRRHRRGVLDPE